MFPWVMVSEGRTDAGATQIRTVDGRVPGRRGRATRRRLLDATCELLAETSYRDLKVIDITKRAGTSPATFYQYFEGVESAVLVLASELVDRSSDHLRRLVVDRDWSNGAGGRCGRRLAAGVLELFDREQALLRVIDLAALEGDERFRAQQTRLLHGVYSALHDLIGEARHRGLVAATTEPRAVAAALTSMLVHVAAHRRGLEQWGVARDELETTLGRIVARSLGTQAGP